MRTRGCGFSLERLLLGSDSDEVLELAGELAIHLGGREVHLGRLEADERQADRQGRGDGDHPDLGGGAGVATKLGRLGGLGLLDVLGLGRGLGTGLVVHVTAP